MDDLPTNIDELHKRLTKAREVFVEKSAKIKEYVREITELQRKVAKLVSDKVYLENVLGLAGKIIDGDQLPDTLIDHPLVRSADEVSRLANHHVSWYKIAQYRWGLLEELMQMLDGGDQTKLPKDTEWLRLLGRIRTELLERIDL